MALSLAVVPDYDVIVPRVQITVTSSPSVTQPVSVYRVHPDGTEWLLLTESRPQVIGGSWVGFDYHAPLNTLITYRAVTATQSGASAATIVPAAEDMVWLIHPSDPELSLLADRIIEFGAPTNGSLAVKSPIMGSAYPVHQNDSPRQVPVGSITVACDSMVARSAMDALLADGGPLLMNTSWDGDLTWLWVQPLDTSPTWPVPNLQRYVSRRYVIPYEATAQPDYDLTAAFTADDLEATGWTAAVAATHYATANDMKLDNRLF